MRFIDTVANALEAVPLTEMSMGHIVKTLSRFLQASGWNLFPQVYR